MMTQHVVAVRIYYADNHIPMADLRMSDGVVETIEWTNVKQRKPFESLINGYTLFYDEREKAKLGGVAMKLTLTQAFEMIDRGETPEEYKKRVERLPRSTRRE